MDRIGYNWDKMTELYRIVVLRIGASLLAVLLAALALAGLQRVGRLLLRRLKLFSRPFPRKLSSIVEPEGILAVNATPTRHGVPRGEAGGIGMELDLYVLPRTVSFSNIAMEEIECFTGTHTGYFNNMEFSGDWSHARECGAGDWHDIGPDNFFFKDNPRIKRSLPRMMDDGAITTNKIYGWKRGTMTWNIPFGWGSHGTTDDSGLVGRLDGYQQVFEMFPDGLACVKKFSNQVTRSTNDVICLNGVLIP